MLKKRKLTDKQELFCQEYLVDLNETQAANRTGYHPDYGRRLYTKVHVKKRIIELQKELREKAQNDPNIATPAQVLTGFTQDSEYDVRKLVNPETGTAKGVHELDDDMAHIVSGFKIKEEILHGKEDDVLKREIEYKLPERHKNRQSLARHYGLFEEDNQQKSGELAEALKTLMEGITGATRGLPNQSQGKIRE